MSARNKMSVCVIKTSIWFHTGEKSLFSRRSGWITKTLNSELLSRKVAVVCVWLIKFCFCFQSVNPYIVKLSIVDDEPTLDVSPVFPLRTVMKKIKVLIEAPPSPQGMGMVVHQALTEYNRWDISFCSRIFCWLQFVLFMADGSSGVVCEGGHVFMHAESRTSELLDSFPLTFFLVTDSTKTKRRSTRAASSQP